MSFFHRWCVFTKHFWFGSDEPFFFFLSSKEKSGMSVSLILLMLFLVRVFFTISPLILGWFGIGFCNYFWFAFHSAILVIWFGLQAWQVNPGLGCFLLSFLLIFFFSISCFYCDIPYRKRASRVRALWVVLVADLLYAFWGVNLRSGLVSPRIKSWGR
jgi:hypothetical protein